MKKRFSFIGVTDVSDSREVEEFLGTFKNFWPENEVYKLQIGPMTNPLIIAGVGGSEWDDIWPKPERLAELFLSDEKLFNTVHYANPNSNDNFLNDLLAITYYGGENLHGIQLDMVWPSIEVLRMYREKNPHIKIILQVGNDSLKQVFDKKETLVDHLRLYEALIDYVLLDMSMGRGIAMNPDLLAQHISLIQDSFPGLGVAVAGGLGPDTAELAYPLLERFKGLSVDAQRKLHRDEDLRKPLDIGSVNMYIIKNLNFILDNS
ncbi:MAG TPA: hypothetical protein VGE63_00500 [Candidatus Paceibacterota bacterium]